MLKIQSKTEIRTPTPPLLAVATSEYSIGTTVKSSHQIRSMKLVELNFLLFFFFTKTSIYISRGVCFFSGVLTMGKKESVVSAMEIDDPKSESSDQILPRFSING